MKPQYRRTIDDEFDPNAWKKPADWDRIHVKSYREEGGELWQEHRERNRRVELYRDQVAQHGRIVQWADRKKEGQGDKPSPSPPRSYRVSVEYPGD